MEWNLKYGTALLASLAALLTPVQPLIYCAVTFIFVDFVTGVWADRKRTKSLRLPWYFESKKAWRTILKLIFTLGGIILAWLIDAWILHFLTLRLANLFTGFVCGVEFWSYLENAAVISENPLFRRFRRRTKALVDQRIADQFKP